MEIERKWLLRTVPPVPPDSKTWVNQFYLSLNPEVRLRSAKEQDSADSNWKFFITIKGEGTLAREEVETAIDGKFYLEALDLKNCRELHKYYLVYNKDGAKVEVSVILNSPSFVYAEVEFNTVTEAMKYEFPWPDLVIEEVTENPEYKMKNYWKKIQ